MKVLIYGDVSPNIIDGSSIWLGSICQVLSANVEQVHVLLKYNPDRSQVLSPVSSLANVTTHRPQGKADIMRDDGGHTPRSAAMQCRSLLDRHNFSVIIVRGREACLAFAEIEGSNEKLWSYITDLPFPPGRVSKLSVSQLNKIASNSKRMLAQTEAARSYLEGLSPLAAGRTLLMPPMIPDSAFHERSDSLELSKNLEFVYAGKFAREWKTDEMLRLPAVLSELGISASLNVIGSKFQASRLYPDWHQQMRTRLESASKDPHSGVTWIGGISREQSLRLIASADFGIGWRTEELDSSLEISTKALEYGAAGAVPIINRTGDHEQLYGAKYPFFVTSDFSVENLADLILDRIDYVNEARIAARRVSENHSMASARRRWAQYFASSVISSKQIYVNPRSIRVLVAAHDFKFLGELLDQLERDSLFEVSIDRWSTLKDHNESTSKKLLADADIVLCEWAGPNLVWYSKNIRKNQRLISRLHGFELRGGKWLNEVDFAKVDLMVFVSDLYREWALRELPIKTSQAVTIPNMLDCSDLLRPKYANAQFNLGLVGYVPYLKRPDRAIDLLECLLEEDSSYNLFFKGRPPWEYAHHWKDRVQAASYLDFFGRIRENSRLRGSVRFDPFSPDIGSWFRNVGVILSPSEHESFHLAPAEGMASGALPVVWEREGACDIFPSEYIHEDLDSMVAAIRSISDEEQFASARVRVSEIAATRWDFRSVYARWVDLLNGSASVTLRAEIGKT